MEVCTMKKKQNAFNIIGAIVLGLLLLVSMVLELANLSANTTKLETGLFNIINLVLSLGFSWLLTRIVTKAEFEESQKRFAISAYRRTTDIAKALDSLIIQIDNIRVDFPRGRLNELGLLTTVATNIQDTVTSSTDDWVDIIGEELRKKEKLQELREKRSAALSSTPDNSDREKQLQELEHQIEQLQSGLPYLLQRPDEDLLPREGRMSNRAWQYFVDSIKNYGYILLKIWSRIELNENNINALIVNKRHVFRIVEPGMFKTLLFVDSIGEVDCDSIGGVYSRDYVFTLTNLLAPIGKPVLMEDSHTTGFEIDGVEYAGVSEDKQYVYVKIPMTLSNLR